jgi:hypothetical protein
LAITSSGSLPSLRSSRTLGREPRPCAFATEPRPRNLSCGSAISYGLCLFWVVNGT